MTDEVTFVDPANIFEEESTQLLETPLEEPLQLIPRKAGRPPKAKNTELIARMYQEGKGIQRIGKAMSLDPKVIKLKLISLGIYEGAARTTKESTPICKLDEWESAEGVEFSVRKKDDAVTVSS